MKEVVVASTTEFTIGADASCTDGSCGEVSRVVVDPIARTVTHLVVEPKHRRGLGRLVPVDLVDATGGKMMLLCSLREFNELAFAEETEFLPGSNGGYGGYPFGQAVAWPYYALGNCDVVIGTGDAFEPVVSDVVPLGEVTVRRGEQVHATDGEIGRVQGLVMDPRDHRVSHVLLQEGHLWGRKEVAIPIGSVASVGDGIRLSITKESVENLPSVAIKHPAL